MSSASSSTTLASGPLLVGAGAGQQLADEMHRTSVNFGRDGDPGWRPWTPDEQGVIIFDLPSTVVNAPRADELALWG